MAKRVKLKVRVEPELYFRGMDLVKAREKLGLSQEEFAEKCGWTQQYQSQLELPGIKHHLDFDKRQRLEVGGLRITTKDKS